MDDLRLWAPVVIALVSLGVTAYRLVRDTTRDTMHDLQEKLDRALREVAEKDDLVRDLRRQIIGLNDEVADLRRRIVDLTAAQRYGRGVRETHQPEGGNT